MEELKVFETQMKRETLIKCFESILIDEPRIAIFRVFPEKYKKLGKHFELENLALKGENILSGKEEIVEMYLNRWFNYNHLIADLFFISIINTQT